MYSFSVTVFLLLLVVAFQNCGAPGVHHTGSGSTLFPDGSGFGTQGGDDGDPGSGSGGGGGDGVSIGNPGDPVRPPKLKVPSENFGTPIPREYANVIRGSVCSDLFYAGVIRNYDVCTESISKSTSIPRHLVDPQITFVGQFTALINEEAQGNLIRKREQASLCIETLLQNQDSAVNSPLTDPSPAEI